MTLRPIDRPSKEDKIATLIMAALCVAFTLVCAGLLFYHAVTAHIQPYERVALICSSIVSLIAGAAGAHLIADDISEH